MSVQLEIADGSPWYLSADVWTVPGSDPQGPQGLPVVGQPCYLWAHVQNTGSDAVTDATVRFYWGNPGVGFDRTTANHIGDASVSLNAADATDVLCLVAWHPTFVNGGHECVLAEAFHPTLDPLPATPDFNVPTDRHVAQRNLNVLQTMQMGGAQAWFTLPFEIHNTSRLERSFTIRTELGKLEELRPFADRLHLKLAGGKKGKLKNFGFVSTAQPCDTRVKPLPIVEGLSVGPGAKVGLSVVGELEGDAALVHVVQEAEDVQVGGLAVLAVHAREHGEEGRN
jgi:hypothetical protein